MAIQMETEANSGTMVIDRSGGYRRVVRGAGHDARLFLVALVFALGLATAGFVAGFSAGPVVFGQMPVIYTETFIPQVSK